MQTQQSHHEVPDLEQEHTSDMTAEDAFLCLSDEHKCSVDELGRIDDGKQTSS
jgi:hypothetical protein